MKRLCLRRKRRRRNRIRFRYWYDHPNPCRIGVPKKTHTFLRETFRNRQLSKRAYPRQGISRGKRYFLAKISELFDAVQTQIPGRQNQIDLVRLQRVLDIGNKKATGLRVKNLA